MFKSVYIIIEACNGAYVSITEKREDAENWIKQLDGNDEPVYKYIPQAININNLE